MHTVQTGHPLFISAHQGPRNQNSSAQTPPNKQPSLPSTLSYGISRNPRQYPPHREAMAQSSLRSFFSYAGSLLSHFQSPFSLLDDLHSQSISSSPSSFYQPPLSGAPSCPLDGPISCHNNTPVTGDSCCFVHPGGRMLLTQFWDQKVHAGGAEEDWTLHGLWCVSYGLIFR